MADEETELFGFNPTLGFCVEHIGLIPGVLVIPGIHNEDVAFFNFHLLKDHFWSVNAVIRNQIGDISNDARSTQIGEGNIRNRATTRIESGLAHQVGPYSVTPVQDLTICALSTAISTGDTLEEMNFKRFFMGMRWREDTATLSQIKELRIGKHINKIFSVHFSPFLK